MTPVSELTGRNLDYWAGKAAKLDVRFDSDMTIQNRQVLYVHTKPWNGADMPSMDRYSPSQWWQQGGHLIDKHDIYFERSNFPNYGQVFAFIYTPDGSEIRGQQYGPTRLIAAMRALVASVYGDSVPDEVEP